MAYWAPVTVDVVCGGSKRCIVARRDEVHVAHAQQHRHRRAVPEYVPEAQLVC